MIATCVQKITSGASRFLPLCVFRWPLAQRGFSHGGIVIALHGVERLTRLLCSRLRSSSSSVHASTTHVSMPQCGARLVYIADTKHSGTDIWRIRLRSGGHPRPVRVVRRLWQASYSPKATFPRSLIASPLPLTHE